MENAYARGIEHLLQVIQSLSMAEHLGAVQRIVTTTARELVGCDGVTFVLRDGDQCHYADEDAISPLWKGSRFPQEACISGWVMRNRTSAVIPDIYADDRIPHEAYRPTFVKSLAMMPVRTLDPVAAIGAYWAEEHTATEVELALLQGLANATSIALEKVAVHGELSRAVEERAAADRRSTTDTLTGLFNRRGFHEQAAAAWPRERTVERAAVAFIDLNGLKTINDTRGHDAGDALLRDAAQQLLAAVRGDDVVARLGGDEFAVLTVGLAADDLERRLVSVLGPMASVGTADVASVEGLTEALLTADSRMYSAKKTSGALRTV